MEALIWIGACAFGILLCYLTDKLDEKLHSKYNAIRRRLGI